MREIILLDTNPLNQYALDVMAEAAGEGKNITLLPGDVIAAFWQLARGTNREGAAQSRDTLTNFFGKDNRRINNAVEQLSVIVSRSKI